MNIRTLKASEIECRIGSVKSNGMSLLLYKDARADMKILDEVFGFDGWERSHEVIDGKLFCTVRVWSEKRNCWISKQDVGTESNAEKEKGQVSDSFKRACVNFGLGRCLYSAPFVWIDTTATETPKSRYFVKEIDYKDHKIIKLVICNEKTGVVVYSYPKNAKVSQKGENAPKNNYKTEKGTINFADKNYIIAFVNAMDREESRKNFWSWLDDNFNTMNLDSLSEQQGKEIIARIKR